MIFRDIYSRGWFGVFGWILTALFFAVDLITDLIYAFDEVLRDEIINKRPDAESRKLIIDFDEYYQKTNASRNAIFRTLDIQY